MESAVPVHALEHNVARSARRARCARAQAGERTTVRSRYQEIAPALQMGTQPNFGTWRACGPENRFSQAGPAIVVERHAARSARRSALDRIISGCAFTKNERHSRLQLTQHKVREPRMRCWGHCGRELCYFRALAYLVRMTRIESR